MLTLSSLTELPRTSQAVVQTAVRSLELRDIPLPAIDADSALLRVEACGICGSDYEQYEGKLPTAPVPVVPGHEPLGTIAAIGDDAARRWSVDVGDRVAVDGFVDDDGLRPEVYAWSLTKEDGKVIEFKGY